VPLTRHATPSAEALKSFPDCIAGCLVRTSPLQSLAIGGILRSVSRSAGCSAFSLSIPGLLV
jgi:hypothetical protein